MNGRGAVIGFSLCCALVFCAFAAPSATALKGTTAYECKPVKEGTAGFTDEHCTKTAEKGKASFEHVLIPNESTSVTIINHETGTFPQVRMKAAPFGVKVSLRANKASSCGGSAVKNTENAKKQMEVAGEGCMVFTEVEVVEPSGCKAKEPIEANIFGTTEVQEVEKKPVGGTGYFPSAGGGGGKPFTTVTLEGAKCGGISGKPFPVEGSVHANMPFEEGKVDGPTLRFSTAQTEKTLTAGGKTAGFEATLTARSATGEKNPVSVTTTES